MATKRISKHIDRPDDVKEILELTHEKACEKSLIMDWFADYGDGSRFNTYDTIDIPKGYYGSSKKNKNEFRFKNESYGKDYSEQAKLLQNYVESQKGEK